jgi:hypothetical protein
MSGTFDPQDEQTLNQALKVQELVVSGADYGMYSVAPGTPIVTSDPYLGVAGNYGILASTAITNSTGTTTITGSLGESPGSTVTGAFTVSGTTDLGNGASLAAQTAAINAFNSLQTLGLSGTVIPAELGGTTLNSPVAGATVAWQSSTSLGLSLTSGHSTLTLNGPGRFVIYSPSTLVTGASGSTDLPVIALTGGALAKNVYFVVGSSATINQSAASSGAVFNGNIIAHTSITVTQIATLNGGLYANTGAITLSEPGTSTAVSATTSTPTINLSIYVNEPVSKVFNAFCKTDASNTMYDFNQAEIAIIDSNLLTISSNTAALPTIVTTSTPHFLYTKEQVLISNSNSTPSLNGVQQVTVTGPYTFALPLNVTVAGTAGSIDKDVPLNDYGVIELLSLPGTAFNPLDVAAVKYTTLPSKFYAQSLPTYNM